MSQRGACLGCQVEIADDDPRAAAIYTTWREQRGVTAHWYHGACLYPSLQQGD